MISLPALAFIFNVVGILGGYIAGVVVLGVAEGAYFQGMYSSVEWADIRHQGDDFRPVDCLDYDI